MKQKRNNQHIPQKMQDMSHRTPEQGDTLSTEPFQDHHHYGDEELTPSPHRLESERHHVDDTVLLPATKDELTCKGKKVKESTNTLHIHHSHHIECVKVKVMKDKKKYSQRSTK
jgi:tetraacyldisaccharide-1-P 4'-kinase